MTDNAKRDADQSHEGFRRGSAIWRTCIEDLHRHEMGNDSYVVGYFLALFGGLLGHYLGRLGEQETHALIAEMTRLVQYARPLLKATPRARLH